MDNLKDKPIKLNDEESESVSGGGENGVVYAINHDICIGYDDCGACFGFCYAIWEDGEKFSILPDLCSGCGGCTAICPTGAMYATRI